MIGGAVTDWRRLTRVHLCNPERNVRAIAWVTAILPFTIVAHPSMLRAATMRGAGTQAAAASQSTQRSEWDVTEARGNTRTIDFTTTEGTWLSVDLAPDGTWITFDLLGHVYRMPASGGAAQAVTQNSGVALNFHPRISPDGRSIALISDRRGQNNLWVMDADGSNPRQVFHDLNSRAVTPAWTPDGQYILVQRSGVGGGGGGGGGNVNGIWMYHRDGGEGVRIIQDAGAQWPSVSADGRYVYYHVGGGDRDALRGHYQVRRFERQSGDIIDITSGTADGAAAGRASSGGAFAPEISPDGRWLAFARHIPDGTVSYKGHRFGPRTALWLLDLHTGEERIALDPINIATESGGKSLRIVPGYAWSRDASSILISGGGAIARLEVTSGQATAVPFQARVQRTISEQAYATQRIDDGPFTSQFLRWQTASPDGRTLAFQSVGRIWLADLPDGTPRRLTGQLFDSVQEFAPAWSPDGQWIVFTTWDDTLSGLVWKAPARGGPGAVRLTADYGEYVHPAWSADGSEVLFARGSGATRRGRTLTHNPWWDVLRVTANPVRTGNSGQPLTVTRVALPSGASPSSVARRAIFAPSWGPEGRIFYPQFRQIDNQTRTALVSVRPDGLDQRTHAILPYADEAVVSPDGQWLAFQEGDNVYVAPLPWAGAGADPITLEKRRGRLPVRQVSREGGLFPRWTAGGTLEFGSGNRYFRYDVATQRTDTFTIALSVPRRVPQGAIALTNARLVTMGGAQNDEVIENGTVVVRGARITCVGACDTSGARVIDATGRTIIPGLIDMHSHHYREHRGYRPLRDYEVGVYLAYGVTTSLDNSMWSQNVFPTAELIEAGRMIGPRTFSTGDPLYSGDAARQNELTSYDIAEQNINRLRSWGAVSLKQYQQPRRDQRQWVSDVARRYGMEVTAEDGDLEYNLGMIMDGQTGFEHPISYMPLYGDAVKFFGQSKTVYSPTLVVGGPADWNIEYFLGESDVWKDPKQRRWMPWRMTTTFLRRRTLRPQTDYSFPLIAQGMADVIAEGGYGAIGSHGEHHGLAAHWEVWMGASALGPLGALRVATLHGAYFLGMQQDLGSIETGKLADLVVLNSNPLANIRATTDMMYVMKGGILYDADTLNEIWPESRPYGPYYWVDEAALRADDRAVDAWRR